MQTLTSKLLIVTTAKQGSVMDRVKSFEDACRETGKSPAEINLMGEGLTDEDMKAITSFYKMSIINKALNGDWIPDWDDKNQPKFYPWFEKKNDGFVLCCVDFDYGSTFVGSRLCYQSRELAKYAATQFIKEYNDFLLF